MGRQLVGYAKGSTKVTYTYNDEGIRTSKTVNGTTTKYTLVDSKITHQTNGTTEMYFRYNSRYYDAADRRFINADDIYMSFSATLTANCGHVWNLFG